MGAKKFIAACVLMRSKILWIKSERVFKTMALHLNLVATLARTLIDQLLDEILSVAKGFEDERQRDR